MKRRIIVFVILLVVGFYFFSQSDYHVHRNQHNALPEGILRPVGEQLYEDDVQRLWILEPQIKNTFHQPDTPAGPIQDPYPNVEGGLEFDPETPNWKFLSETKEGGSSYEAILQPDGSYLTAGPKQGTYNYGHPIGLWGMIKHVVLDAIPHFFNGNYGE
ncbi:MAG: hypothetical protein AAF466_10410 [Bacteroidota bacterium]